MARKTITSSIQLSLFPQEEARVKDVTVARAERMQAIKNYLHTREGLWRLLTCMPSDITVVEALSTAPQRIFGVSKGQEGGAA